MKVTILQTDIAWADPEENIRRAEALMAQAEASDLYVLPEMWATGFAVEPEGVAEEAETSAALAWMRRTARERGCALSGSLAVRAGDGTYRNRHYFVTPADTVYYDKRHLFTYGHEDERYTAGAAPVVAHWQGWRLLLLTCYDLRFPVFMRYGRPLPSSAALEYDAIVCVANWPGKRQPAWDTLVRARAIENQCYLVAVNRVGSDPQCQYAGGSAVIDPVGRTLVSPPPQSSSATADIHQDRLHHMRQHFPVLQDRDALIALAPQ